MGNTIPIPGLRWRGLTLQVLALIVLPLIALLLVFIFGSLTLHQRAMRTLVGERDERAARTSASALSEQLNHRAAAVQGLALRASDNTHPDTILDSSDFLLLDFGGGLAFFSTQGELLTTTGDEALWENLPEEAADIVTQVDTQPLFTAPLPHPTNGNTIVLVAAAAGGTTPIAVGAFYPTTLARRTLVGALAPGEEAIAFVVSQNKQLLYQTGDFTQLESLSSHPGVNEALRGESGTTYVPIEDSEHVIAFSPVIPTGWALVIEEPWEDVTSPLLNTTQVAPLILVPVLLLALVALWFGARQIVQPLQSLETRAADLAWGDYSSIEEPVGGIEEIKRLQHTLIHMARKVERAQDSLRSYIGAITSGQEEERHRLARELHDDTIQALIALNQRVQLTRLKLGDNTPVCESLDEIQTLTEQTIQNLRRLTRALRPFYLEDLGLVAALEMLAQEITEAEEISIEFTATGREQRLSPDTELALYRITQEALRNVIRHANAQNAWLTFQFAPQNVSLTIADDGNGFEVPESPAEFAPSGHFGLLGMYERAELINAQLEILSAPGEGTSIVIFIPNTSEDSVYINHPV